MLSYLTIALLTASSRSSPAPPVAPVAQVLVLETVAPGVAAPDRAHIDARIAAVLAEGKVPTAPAEARTAARACATEQCLARTAADHGVTHWLRAEIDGNGTDREYHVRVSAGEIGSATALATSAGDCLICGIDDLTSAVEARLLNVRAELTGSTARGSTIAPPPPPVAHRETGPRDARRGVVDVLRPTGIALLAAGSASMVGGAVLLGIHGNEIRRRCADDRLNLDADGDCRFVHATRGGGIALLTGGILAAAGGITLVSIERRKRRTDLRARLGFNRVVISGRF